MRKLASRLLFLACTAFLATTGCQDEGGGLQQTVPLADSYRVSDTDEIPAQPEYTGVSSDGVISVDFGRVVVASLSTRYLFIRNGGRGELKLYGIEQLENSGSAFQVGCRSGALFATPCEVSEQQPVTVPAGGELGLRLDFVPVDTTSYSAAYLLETNAEDHPTIRLELSGTGVSPDLQVCITDCTGDEQSQQCAGATELCSDSAGAEGLSIAFGDAELGQAVRRKLVIRNRGDEALNIGNLGITSGDYNQFELDLNGNALPGTLGAGAEVELWVEYSPSVGGEHESLLAVGSNDPDTPTVIVGLQGRGMAPRLCPEPLSLDFGNVPTGESKAMSFDVTNCGLLDLELTAVQFSAQTQTQDFVLADVPPLPLVLAPGEGASITVEYRPAERGSDHGGVDLYSNDPASDPQTGLTGTIVLRGQSTPRECDLVATPYAVNFGGVVQASTRQEQLILTNMGTDTCTVERAEITENSPDGEFAIDQAPALPGELLPGDSMTFTLSYSPGAVGQDRGVLSIFGNDKDGSELKVELVGEGVEQATCDVVIEPAPFVNFGLVKLGNTKSMLVQITNQGLAPCTLTGAEVENVPLFGQDFSLTSQPPYPAQLGPRGSGSESVALEVTFAPQREWGQISVLHIHVDDDDLGDLACTDSNSNPIPHEACLQLTAYAKESEIEVVPGELDFGVVTVGCNSPELCVNVYNLGTVAYSIDSIELDDPANPNFEITSAPMTPFQLAGGASFQVCLRYHPQDDTPHRAVLIIRADGDEEHTVPLFGRGTYTNDQVDVFYQPDRVRSDVLFVVDCSGSMGDDQQNLANNFDSFINWAQTLDVDFQIGVIATEVEDNPGYTGTPPRQVHPGVLVNTSSTPKIITNQTPDVIGAFTDNVRLGDDCSNHEAGLEAAWLALSQPLIDDPQANAGFLREDAKLYIIILSDEPDQSKGQPDFYVDFFRSLKGYRNTEMMTVSAICADNPPDGRYYYVTQQTGGIFESILTTDWASTLQALGFDAFAAIREFPLSRPADSSSITVTVNGNPVPQASSPGGADGWTYYPDTNSIYFGDDYVPGKGDRIEVHYDAACL